MQLRIDLFGPHVQIFIENELIDLGRLTYLLGLMTPWNWQGSQSVALKGEQLYRLIPHPKTQVKKGDNAKVSTLEEIVKRQQNAIRQDKETLQDRLVKLLNLPGDTKLEQIVADAEVDVVIFKRRMTEQLNPRNRPDEAVLEQTLLLYDNLFHDEATGDMETEDIIVTARRFYEFFFFRGVTKLLAINSPLIHNVVANKRDLITMSPMFEDIGPGLIDGYREATRRRAIEIPLEQKPLRIDPKFRDQSGRLTNRSVRRQAIIGRDTEVNTILTRLQDNWLITLTGMGGAGKTSVAERVMHKLLTTVPQMSTLDGAQSASKGGIPGGQQASDDLADGIFFIDLVQLAPDADVQALAIHIINEMGGQLTTNEGPYGLLMDYLRDKHLLLILDNCEHISNTVAELVQAIGRCSPFVKLLLTTRVARGSLWGKQIRIHPFVPLDPDTSPDLVTASQNPAVQLFVHYRQMKFDDFVFTDQNVAPVVQLCHLLGGIPLAIELVANDGNLLTDIASSITRHWKSIPQDLSDVQERHSTLAHCLLWSYNNLRPDEQALFRRLGLFPGGWTMDICKEVCAIKGLSKEAIPQHLGTLSDSFLISFDTSLNRYRFLEPVRGFAEHQLELSGEKEDILTSFENWWLPTTRMDDFTSIGSANRQYLGRILNEVANADSYVNHRSGGNDDTAIRALEAELQSSVIRFADGAFRTVRKRFTPFLSVLGRMPDRTRMKSFLTMAVLDFMAGDYSEAYVHATRGLAVAKQLSDRKHQALGNVGIGLCETFLNRPEGETHVREGLRIAQEIQDNWALGIGHMGVGAWHWQQGESALSLAEYLKSLDFFRKSEDNMMCALTLNSVAHLVRQGDMPVKAAHYYLESYDLSLDGNFKNGRGVAGCILGTCGLAITMKWDDEAALFWGAGTTHYEKLGAKAIPPIQTDYERDMLEVRNRMGVRYQTLYDEGTQLSLMDAAHRAHAVIKKISGLDHP